MAVEFLTWNIFPELIFWNILVTFHFYTFAYISIKLNALYCSYNFAFSNADLCASPTLVRSVRPIPELQKWTSAVKC